jgi:uncharacterized protein
MLRPRDGEGKKSLLVEDESDATDANSEQTPTKISLSVVERCGKCGGPFNALFLDGLIVDRCASCRGVWLDASEIERMIGGTAEQDRIAAGEKLKRAPLDRLVGSCPTCKIGLVPLDVPDQPAAFEVCTRCFGMWFDRGELRLLHDRQVLKWLRAQLDQLKKTHRASSRV